MKKNVQLKLVMTSEELEKIKRLATEQRMTMSLYCMRKILTPPELEKIERALIELNKKLSLFTDDKEQRLNRGTSNTI